MNIAENLQLLATTKEDIRQTIIAKGGSLETTTPFSDYAAEIYTLGSDELAHLIKGDAEEVTIPDGVTSIAAYKFYMMDNLFNVSMPYSLTTIGDSAFFGCSNLARVDLTSVTTIGDYAFGACYSLGNIDGMDALESIGNGAFNGCENLMHLVFPNTLTTIGSGAFVGCFGLESVTIPDSVTSIGSEAFEACRNMESITCLATTPPTLGSNAFNSTNNCPIYVPAASVAAYQAAPVWSDYASRIESE